jgi:hypothetical protein
MSAIRIPVIGLAICTVVALGMIVNRPALAQPVTDVQQALAQEKTYSSGAQQQDRDIAVAKAKERWYERYYGTHPVSIVPDRQTTVAQAQEDYYASYGTPTAVAQSGTGSSGSTDDGLPWLLIAISAGGVLVLGASTVMVRRQKSSHAMA